MDKKFKGNVKQNNGKQKFQNAKTKGFKNKNHNNKNIDDNNNQLNQNNDCDKSKSEESRKFYDIRKKNKELKEKYVDMYYQYISERKKRQSDDYSNKMMFCGILKKNTNIFLNGQLVLVYPHKIQGDYSCRIVSNDGREDFVSFNDVKRLSF